jgi:hypothetical protein
MCWPVEANGRRLAIARVIAWKDRSRSPYRDKWERNGADWLCRVHDALGYVTPADGVAGLGVRILAERDRLLREARDSRAVGQSRGGRGWVKGTTASD